MYWKLGAISSSVLNLITKISFNCGKIGVLFFLLVGFHLEAKLVKLVSIVNEDWQNIASQVDNVFDLSTLIKGKELSYESLDLLVKDLYASGRYKSVKVNVYPIKTKSNGVHVEFILAEKSNIVQVLVSLDKDSKYITEEELSHSVGGDTKLEYHPTVVKRIKNNLLLKLRKKGFYKPVIKITSKRDQSDSKMIRVYFEVFPDIPCFISEIIISKKVSLSQNDLDVQKGAICDEFVINEKLELVNQKLLNRGFYKSSIRHRFIYNADENNAQLLIEGDTGKQVRYIIEDDSMEIFLANERDKAIDFANLEPEEILYKIEDFYKARGYYFVDVKMSQEKMGKEKVSQEEVSQVKQPDLALQTFLFKVVVGPKVTIENFLFKGNNLITNDELAALLLEVELNLNLLFQKVFSEKIIRQHALKLESLYLERGFTDVRVQIPDYDFSDDRSSVVVKFEIEEGKPYLIRGVNFVGNKDISTDFLQSLVVFKAKKPLNQQWVSGSINAIKQAYLEKGYLNIKVDLKYKINYLKGYNSIDVQCHIDEGKQVIIGKITYWGLKYTKTVVIERELTFKTGSVYTAKAIADTRNKLITIGLFESVIIEINNKTRSKRVADSTDTTDKVDIIIKVKEKKPGLIELKPGWGTYKGARFALEVTFNNLGGFGGRRAFMRMKVSEEAQQESLDIEDHITGYELLFGFVEPYIRKTPIQSRLTILQSASAEKTYHLFNRTVEIGFSKKIYKYLHGNISYKWKSSRYVRDVILDETARFLTTDLVRIGALVPSLFIDWRDTSKWTLRGGVLSFSIDIVRKGILLSDMDYDKLYFHGSLYQKIYRRISLNFKTQIGLINLYDLNACLAGSDSLCLPPEEERFFAGGTGSVRGFEEMSLGPSILVLQKDNSYKEEKIGGTLLLALSFELKFPMPLSDNFGSILFFDAGNVFLRQDELQQFVNQGFEDPESDLSNFWDIKYSYLNKSVGFGLVFFHVFNFHMDWGIPLPKIEEYGFFPAIKHGRLHLNIGGVF